MTHYEVRYDSEDREADDRKAIQDIQEYLGDSEQFCKLLYEVRNPKRSIQGINMMCALIGISGYPFHALCRKYRLADYREWMHSGDDAVMTDEAGFAVRD